MTKLYDFSKVDNDLLKKAFNSIGIEVDILIATTSGLIYGYIFTHKEYNFYTEIFENGSIVMNDTKVDKFERFIEFISMCVNLFKTIYNACLKMSEVKQNES